MDEKVIFQRGKDEDGSDIWDDTALVKAYDEAIKELRGQLPTDHAVCAADNNSERGKRKKKSRRKPRKEQSIQSAGKPTHWKVGDHCRALFTEDDVFYEAVIKSIKTVSRSCIVRYVGYGNEEEQCLDDLLPSLSTNQKDSSHPPSVRTESVCSERESDSNPSGMDWQQKTPPQNPFPPFMPDIHGPRPAAPMGFPFPPWQSGSMHMPPIPPPPLLDMDKDGDKDAMYSMLMSWYMSGYHTGYYQGLKEARKGKSKSKRS